MDSELNGIRKVKKICEVKDNETNWERRMWNDYFEENCVNVILFDLDNIL